MKPIYEMYISNGVLKASREIFGDDFIEGHEFLMAWFTKKEISI